MKQFQDLEIQMNTDAKSMIEKITQILSPNWSRNTEKEERIGGISKQFCFDYSGDGLNAGLWLVEGNGLLTVTNIVPNKSGKLSIDEYNRILNTFAIEIDKIHFKYVITKDDITIDDLLSPDSVEKLKSFSLFANKSTGHSHPLDESRWFDFILSMVKRDEYISPDEFQFFLEELGWDSASAYELYLDFEYGYAAMKFVLQH
ncbi:MAG: hypothetical protein PHO27_02320 [Sulfuricurvum sp.]|nr:hypothetical protein [Sulfuricurvum sp.]